MPSFKKISKNQTSIKSSNPYDFWRTTNLTANTGDIRFVPETKWTIRHTTKYLRNTQRNYVQNILTKRSMTTTRGHEADDNQTKLWTRHAQDLNHLWYKEWLVLEENKKKPFRTYCKTNNVKPWNENVILCL